MNILIAGGGTAGWLTAIYVKQIYPESQVTLIESEEIGILGAGEGSNPHLISLFNFLNINLVEIIKNTDATIKNGINFVNWNKKNESYFHPFDSIHPGSNDYNYSLTRFLNFDTAYAHIYGNKFDHGLHEYSFIQRMSSEHRVPFTFDGNRFYSEATWSLHFNARKLAEFLRKIGELRGIRRVEGVISSIKNDDTGRVYEVSTKDISISCDFVFDCTGFARLFIGKHFKAPWKSHSKHLPTKKAIPFFLDNTDELPPYTESTALDYGWMWKIPVQDRFGCGYVFDSDFISEEDAKKEIDRLVGKEVVSPKTFSFNPGCYEQIWIKNCLAVGLSSGFVEPLEATSLYQLVKVLQRFLENPNNINSKNTQNIDNFNRLYMEDTQEVVDFLYLHYLTNKKNTNFWKDFKENNIPTDFVSYILEIIKERPISLEDFKGRDVFNIQSYFYILIGNGIMTKDMLKSYLKNMGSDKSHEYLSILAVQNQSINSFPTHKEFINKILTEV